MTRQYVDRGNCFEWASICDGKVERNGVGKSLRGVRTLDAIWGIGLGIKNFFYLVSKMGQNLCA